MARPHQLFALPVALAGHRAAHRQEHGLSGAVPAELPPACDGRRRDGELLRGRTAPCAVPNGTAGGAASSSRSASSPSWAWCSRATVPPSRPRPPRWPLAPPTRAGAARPRLRSARSGRRPAADPAAGLDPRRQRHARQRAGVTAALEATGDVQRRRQQRLRRMGPQHRPHLGERHSPASSASTTPRWSSAPGRGTTSSPNGTRHAYLVELTQALQHHPGAGRWRRPGGALAVPPGRAQPYVIDPHLAQAATWTAQNAQSGHLEHPRPKSRGDCSPATRCTCRPTDCSLPMAASSPGTRPRTGAWIRARKLDNTHMCPYGSAEIGALVIHDLTPLLGLRAMAPGWELGSWVHDPNFDDPPGACPDDQPPLGVRRLPYRGRLHRSPSRPRPP